MSVSKGFPLTQKVDVFRRGEPEIDRFGNQRPGKGRWEPVKVFGWAINKTEEKDDESVLRTIDDLALYAPAETAPQPEEQVRIPDGSVWQVAGHAETYEANPWWQPGLVVVHCRKVEG